MKQTREKTNSKHTGRFPLKIIIAIILILAVYLAWSHGTTEASPGVLGASVGSAAARTSETITAPDTLNSSDSDYMIKIGAPDFTDPVPVSEIIDAHYLELINGDYPIVQEPDDNSLVSVWPSVPVLSTNITLNAAALSAVSDMRAAARGSVSGSFYISSGYRDYAEQQRLYDASADKSYVQPPGHSEHESGLAADIMVKGVSQADMGATQEGQWLAENSWRFGLILRYPKGKRDVTGISYEPWHFRYIGQPHAWYCSKNNICYEEYIQFLKDNGGYQVTIGGMTYSVLYEIPENDMISVPDSQNYTVSGDNTRGYIVTAWK